MHIGVVVQIGGFGDIWVLSKWGPVGEYIHKADEVLTGRGGVG